MVSQIDLLIAHLNGKRVGLLVNPTSVSPDYTHLIDLLTAADGVEVVALFGPEHGVRGCSQAGVETEDYVDRETGLPVYALYGPRRAPEPAQLDMLDVLVFDIQDVGARFYTYCWSMTYAMEACAKAGKEFVVFDRPNPVGCLRVEGAPLRFDCGIIGRYWEGRPVSIPVRHGMTMGEFATLVNEEYMSLKVNLFIVKMNDYRRGQTFGETGFPWVFPSPNMPSIHCAEIYLGTCVFEGSNLSEGRGTTLPFELIGAPWVDGESFARHMNAKNLLGVRFRPVIFEPTFSKFKGEVCGGVQVHVVDASAFSSVDTGLHLLKGFVDVYGDKVVLRDWCDRLMGVRGLSTRIRSEKVEDICAAWQDDLREFLDMRAKYLLYSE